MQLTHRSNSQKAGHCFGRLLTQYCPRMPRRSCRHGTNVASIVDIPDELFILIAANGGLSLRDFGRLACVASRFWVCSVETYRYGPQHSRLPPGLMSVMEAAAQRRLQSLGIRQPQVDFLLGGVTFVCEVCLYVRRPPTKKIKFLFWPSG